MFSVRNISNINVFAGNVNLEPGHSTEVSSITSQLVTALERGLVSISPSIPSSTPTLLTDNSGGVVSTTIAAVPASYTQTQLANALASIIAQVNANSTAIAQMQSDLIQAE